MADPVIDQLLQEFVAAYPLVFSDGLNRHEKPVLEEYVAGLKRGEPWLSSGKASQEENADASLEAFARARSPLSIVERAALKTFLHYLLVTKPLELKKAATQKPGAASE